MKRKSLFTSAIVCAAVSLTFGMATVQLQASAQGTQPAYTSVADLDFKMVDGAWIREASTLEEAGIRFQMTMPAEEYAWLMENTGEDKKYEEVTFGMFIAPNYYHGLKNLNDQANVLGASRVYGWLKDGETVWTESADYKANNNLVQILNTEGDMSVDKENSSLYSYYGSAIGMKEANLTTEYIGVGYIRYTQGDVTSYEFATTADNARSITYLTQCAVESGALDSSKTAHQEMIDEYIGKVANKSVEYTVEYYAVGAAENAEPLFTEKQTANINTKITIDPAVASKKVAGYVFNERSNPDLYKVVSVVDQTQDTAIQKTVYANNKTLLKVYLDDATLFDFEEFNNGTDETDKTSLAYLNIKHINNNGATMSIAETLPSPFTGQGLQFNFNADWKLIPFYNWNATKLARAIDAGYTYLKMDVYYQGEDTGTAWITPFGLGAKSLSVNSWVTLSFPLKASDFGTYTSGIIFNLANQSNYTVYVDNIRLDKDTTPTYEYLYNGFENDTKEDQGWRYVGYYENITVSSAQTEVVKSGSKSLKLVSTATYNYVDLKDSSNVALDNAWIKARAGKTLSFWIYYKNDTFTTDKMWFTVGDGSANIYQKQHAQGEWMNVIIDLDDIQDFTKIRLIINSENLSSGAVYLDHFELY